MGSSIKIVWSKEIYNIIGNIRILTIYLVIVVSMPIAAFYGVSDMVSQIPVEILRETLTYIANFFAMYYSIPIALIVSYSLLNEIFYREKMQGALSTLLSAPVTVEEVVVGKTLSVVTFAYPLTLFSIFVFLLTLGVRYPQWSITNIDRFALIHLFTSLPLLCFGVTLSVGTLILVLKRSIVINLAFFMTAMALMYLGRSISKHIVNINNIFISLLLLGLASCLFGYILVRNIHTEQVI